MMKKLGSIALVCLVTIGCNQQAENNSPEEATTPSATTSISNIDTFVAEEMAPAAIDVVDTKPPAGHFVQADSKLSTLKAKFIYGGKPPVPKRIDSSRDPFCANLNIPSETMVIGKSGEIRNLVIYLDTKKTEVEIPAKMLEVPPAKIKLDNKGCVFIPHVIFVRPGQTIEVWNSDQSGHNANFTFFNNVAGNYLIPAGGKKEIEITADERSPMPVECNIHPWMKAHVLVKEHPYVGISDEKGEITIENLPVGELTFRVWHENSDRSIDEVDINGKKEKWKRGYVTVNVKAGMNDLGTITIAPDKFKEL